ncbi:MULTISPECIES: L-lactate permease [unclassified Pseudoclavibacter]|uniref:L-lactate permease n=1 Tax=unclassified Pseudoclavibacter TaxID=2615177 RepID=UPI0013012164|nr:MULTISPECIES: L-lactate permease [unclassified Pseudoclavibacter]KAB1645573.1 L-lactate permease [Pseudoclavibacter sp. CFCC 14310]KAB1645968.1 L-lactate permease [Pseudoclavibacter sp. CFCC 14310]KAB1663728.1 L-lactate permease [Pseudoclavibacter sp. CFCC 13611]KAB1664523.1 L-lactate permease [Pseudoclavibacter sp. CFCC 13611]
MWTQPLDPTGNLALSAGLAAVPVIFFLVALVGFKMKGTTAAAIAAVLAVIVAFIGFGMPASAIGGAALDGVLNGLWPIGYIILMAVWLYKLAVRSGKFDVIRNSISGIAADQRIQVLLIAFCFGAFLEGAAGFGVPITICAALLLTLGFPGLKAAVLALISNAAAGAFGAIGIPVIIAARQGDVPIPELSGMMVLVGQLPTIIIPFLLVAILDGFRGIREVLPALITVVVAFSGSQAVLLLVLGQPDLADIIPSIVALAALAVLSRFWKPKRTFRMPGAPEPVSEHYTPRQLVSAWSPFLFLTVLILIWSAPFFANLFDRSKGGALSALSLLVSIPGLDGQVTAAGADAPMTAVWTWSPIGAAGTAILVSVLLTALTSSALTWKQVGEEFVASVKMLWQPILLILLIMIVAYIANFSGGSTTIGHALASVGALFPLLSPVIGWLGVFITGSVVNNNTLFAHLQSVTATEIGTNPTLLVSANVAGGGIGKIVSPQSIAVSSAAVGLAGKESAIMRAALPYSLGLLVVLSLWVFALSAMLG